MHSHSDLSEWETIPTIHIKTHGNLSVHASEGRYLEIDSEDEDPQVVIEEDEIVIKSGVDLIVHVPVKSALSLRASGDTVVDVPQARLMVEKVSGNLVVDRAGDVEIRGVAGDLHINEADHVLCGRAGGNVFIANVKGRVVADAGGDLHVENGTELAANAGGDIHCQISAGSTRVQARAGGDIHCEIAEGVSAHVRAICGGELRVSGAHSQSRARGHGVHLFTLGGGEHEISLVAGGDVHMDGAAEISELHSVHEAFNRDMSRFGEEMGRFGEEMGREFGSLGSRIAEKINRKVQSKVERTMRQAEAKAGKSGSFAFGFSMPEPPVPPVPPVPPRTLRRRPPRAGERRGAHDDPAHVGEWQDQRQRGRKTVGCAGGRIP